MKTAIRSEQLTTEVVNVVNNDNIFRDKERWLLIAKESTHKESLAYLHYICKMQSQFRRNDYEAQIYKEVQSCIEQNPNFLHTEEDIINNIRANAIVGASASQPTQPNKASNIVKKTVSKEVFEEDLIYGDWEKYRYVIRQMMSEQFINNETDVSLIADILNTACVGVCSLTGKKCECVTLYIS